MNTITLKEDMQIGRIIIKKGTKVEKILKEDFRPDQVLYNGIRNAPRLRGGADLAMSIMDITNELDDMDFIKGLIDGLTTGKVY